MKRILSTGVAAVLLSLVFSVLTLNYLVTGDPLESFASVQEVSVEGVTGVDGYFHDRKIYLDIHTDKKLSCKDVTKLLNIETLQVRKRSYIPSCSVVNDGLVQIVYIEGIEA